MRSLQTAGALGQCLIDLARSRPGCRDASIVWDMDRHLPSDDSMCVRQWWFAPGWRSALPGRQAGYVLCDVPKRVVIVLSFDDEADIARVTRELSGFLEASAHRMSHLLRMEGEWGREHKARRLEDMSRVLRAIGNYASSSLDMKEIFLGIHAETGMIVPADSMAVASLDGKMGKPVYVYRAGYTGHVIDEIDAACESCDLVDARLMRFMNEGVIERNIFSGSMACHIEPQWAVTTLSPAAMSAGILYMAVSETPAFFHEEDRLLLEVIAGYVSMALERRR
ncbi:hypothetical protein [Luteibacter sp.]|uniref:hypothetical protein n=1 Tax=Luteibacter sp. TaxID=1886636 RepID=UPI0025C1150E|nr:hypothetical protein [Luteibacter sp.]